MKYVTTAIALVLGVVTSQASLYTDTVDAGGGGMDITQVEVTHDALNINFAITFDGTDIGLDTQKQIGILFDTAATVGAETTANAWNSSHYMSGGMDFYSGAWNDGAGNFEMNTYSAALGGWPEWSSGDNTWAEWTSSSMVGNTINLSVSRATLGVTGATDEFDFDVVTSWSSGSWTQDGLGSTIGGSGSFDSSVNGVNTYAIPEPASLVMVLMSGGGMLFIRRRFKI